MTPQELMTEVLEQVQGSWRYRWFAAALTWAVCVTGWFYVFTLPDIYKASARVYVDTEGLLKPLMQGLTAQGNTRSEVQLVSTAVLTRPNLENIARETDLDLRARSPEQFEQLISALQTEIHVSGGRDNIFRIEYEDTNREMARNVVDAVLNTFVEGAIQGQSKDADVTEKALAGEIHEHEQRLSTAEAALTEFKKSNVGYMPGQSGDYYTQLQTALSASSGTQAAIRQMEARRDELARQIEGEEPAFGIVGNNALPSCPEAVQISELQTQLAKLLVDFTEKHPRVVVLNEQIAELQKRCAQSPQGLVVSPGNKLELNPVYQNLRVQLTTAEGDLAEAKARLRDEENTVARLRADVDKIAEVEGNLKQLNRDYDVVQARHKELLRRWEDLQAKKRLDPVTDNVQYRTIEPPFTLPDPVGPQRPLFLLGILAFALGLGGAVAFGLNRLYPVYFTRRSVSLAARMPVLGSVTMLLDHQTKRHRFYGMLAWSGAYVLLLVSAVLVIALASRGSELLRGLINQIVA